jgi:hypothetical protein
MPALADRPRGAVLLGWGLMGDYPSRRCFGDQMTIAMLVMYGDRVQHHQDAMPLRKSGRTPRRRDAVPSC